MSSIFFVLFALVGLLFWCGIGFAVFLYIRRSLLHLRSEGEGSIHDRILDEVQRVQIEMGILADRLERIEGRLDRLPAPDHPQGALPEDAGGGKSEAE